MLFCPHPAWDIVRVQSALVTSPVPQHNWICWLKHYSRSSRSMSDSWGTTVDIWCVSFWGSFENSRCNSLQNWLICPLMVRTFVRVSKGIGQERCRVVPHLPYPRPKGWKRWCHCSLYKGFFWNRILYQALIRYSTEKKNLLKHGGKLGYICKNITKYHPRRHVLQSALFSGGQCIG